MRWTRLLALFILLLVPLTSHAQTQTHRPPRSTTVKNAVKSNEADIRQWLDRWAKAFRAHDVNAIMSLYAPGVVAYDLVPPLQYVNGMITNDKFCCTRWCQLRLSWWRRPLRLREESSHDTLEKF
jgi:hypothetical protein